MILSRRSLLASLGVALPAVAVASTAKAASPLLPKHHAKKHVHTASAHTSHHRKAHHAAPAAHPAPLA